MERSDGTVDVALLGDGVEIVGGTIDAPWAVDANGESPPTRYAVNGNTLTHVVVTDGETAFPVAADPRIRSGCFGGTLYLTRTETKLLAAGATGCAAVSGLVAALGGPLALAIAGAISASCGVLAAFAGAADAVGKCVRWNWYGAPPRAGQLWWGAC